MYESPINKFMGEMQTQMVKDEEGQLMVQVTQAIGYDVDKDELIKALSYDRQQYQKGYEDGLKASKWIFCSERLPEDAEPVFVFYERNAWDDSGKFRKKDIDKGWQVDGMWHVDG